MPKLLGDSDINSRLRGLKGWRHERDFLTKTFKFDSFMDGIAFINRLALVAEEKQHHPDIKVRYTSIKLSIQTHSEGGITRRDFELASAIEEALLVSRRHVMARQT